MVSLYLRRIVSADREPVAGFLDERTTVLRWLVAFFRHLDDLPEEEEPYWNLWRDDAGRGTGGGGTCDPPRLVAAHFFRTATSYVCADLGANPGTVLRSLEHLLEEDLLPERLVGDGELMERWRAASPAFFERASGFEAIDVLVSGGDAAHGGEPSGFRAAQRGDLPILDEYGRLHAAESREEFLGEYESLVEHGLVFVLEEEGTVKGLVRSNLSDGRYVHAGGLFVHPLYRGKGVGRALARGLAARVRAAGGSAVILDAYRKNESALRAYLAAGYREIGTGLEARFDEGAWGG